MRKLFRELYTSLGCASTGKHWDWDHIDTDHMNDQSSSGSGAAAAGVGVGAVGAGGVNGKKDNDNDVILISDTTLKMNGAGGNINSSSAAVGGGMNMQHIQQMQQYNHTMDMLRPSTAAAVAPYNPREIINLADEDDEESGHAHITGNLNEYGDDAEVGYINGTNNGMLQNNGNNGVNTSIGGSLSALAQEDANRLKMLRNNNVNTSTNATGITTDYNAINLTSNIAQKRPHTSHISGSGMNTINYTTQGNNQQMSGTMGSSTGVNSNGVKKALDSLNVDDVSL